MQPVAARGAPRPTTPSPRRRQILPMENEGGRALVEGGKLCERKNGRGVDTNRNWGVDWGVKEKDYDPAEEFPGRAPLRCGAAPGLRTHAAIAQPPQPPDVLAVAPHA
jgi:hypothetical protein